MPQSEGSLIFLNIPANARAQSTIIDIEVKNVILTPFRAKKKADALRKFAEVISQKSGFKVSLAEVLHFLTYIISLLSRMSTKTNFFKKEKNACLYRENVVIYVSKTKKTTWGHGAVGSAFEWHSKGQGFSSSAITEASKVRFLRIPLAPPIGTHPHQ